MQCEGRPPSFTHSLAKQDAVAESRDDYSLSNPMFGLFYFRSLETMHEHHLLYYPFTCVIGLFQNIDFGQQIVVITSLLLKRKYSHVYILAIISFRIYSSAIISFRWRPFQKEKFFFSDSHDLFKKIIRFIFCVY